MSSWPLSLYLHIPFCQLKCSYCDFNSYVGLEELVGPYVEALTTEMGLWRPVTGDHVVNTVFFGGGTPSLLPIEHLGGILEVVYRNFSVADDSEVSLEANPGTVDRQYLRGLRSLGVNRLSFGVQSFHDDELAALDRLHSAAEAKEAYWWARQAGFENVNLDLIYGLPEQALERWQSTLEEAITLEPDHLSLYALTVEEGTKLAYDISQGRVPEPDGDAQAEMYEWSGGRLAAAGYEHYEISNWAMAGGPRQSRGASARCRHNLTYWENRPYLGLGAGAHSYLEGNKEQGTLRLRSGQARNKGYRFAEVYSPRQYIRRVEETAQARISVDGGISPLLRSMRQVACVEEMTPALTMSDTLILGLRLTEGVSLGEFRRRFEVDPLELYGATIQEMEGLGLVELMADRLRLTPRGRLLANEVFVRFLPD